MNQHFIIVSLCCSFLFLMKEEGVCQQSNPNSPFTSTTRAVVVGISEYQDASLPAAPGVRKDAELFAAFLRSRSGGLLPSHHIQLRTGAQATLAQFSTALAWIEEESLPRDHVVLYLSGHAKMLSADSAKKPYFFFSDSPSVPAVAGALSLSSICISLQEVCSRKSLTFSLYLQIDVLPAEEAQSDDWREWMQAFRASFPSAWVNWSKGKSEKPTTFTQLLIDATLGPADRNNDGSIIPREAAHYFKSERKSVRDGYAFMMAFSKREEIIGEVVSESRKSSTFENRENDLFPSLVGMEVTKLEDSLLSKEDEKTLEWYNDFIINLKLGQLIEPPGRCASDLYDSLTQIESLAPLHSHWRRKLGASLLDETQQALNAYLKTDTKEIFRRWKHADHYATYPLYIDKAIELMGTKSFMISILKTKLHYFEGLKARLDGMVSNTDKMSYYEMALLEQQIALTYEPEAAFVWNELGVVYSLLENDSSEYCFKQALLYSPTWGIPYSNLSFFYREKKDWVNSHEYAKKSVELNPWNVIALNSYGISLMKLGEYELAGEQFRQAIATDISYVNSYYNLSCLQSILGEVVSSAHWLDQAIKKGYSDWSYLSNDGDLENLRKTLQYKELKMKYKIE